MRSARNPSGAEADIGIPEIIAGEIDVLPADGREVGEQRIRDHFACRAQVIERTAEIHGVPERDSGGDEGEPARTILLRLDRAIAQAGRGDGSRRRGRARCALRPC